MTSFNQLNSLTLFLLSLSLFVQSFEYLALANHMKSASPLNWNNLRGDFLHLPKLFIKLFDFIYNNDFKLIIVFQLFFILFLPYSTLTFSFLLIITNFLILFRLRGTFNGGSDYMTILTLIGLLIANNTLFGDPKPNIGYTFIAIQTTLSYFIAGIVKLKTKDWRSGHALQGFITFSNYSTPNKLQAWASNLSLCQFSSYLVILFECTFPIIWIFPNLTAFYLTAGLSFHLINYYCLGINRFVLAWLATYPALFFCTH